MKRLMALLLLFTVTLLSFGQIYYQQVDKKVSVGVGKNDKVTQLVILTKSPKFELIVGDRFIKTKCNELDKHNYEHIVIIPNFTLEIIKEQLRHGSVFIDGREYSALDIGSAIAAAEWYSDYYHKRPQEFRPRRFHSKPFMINKNIPK